MIKPVKKSVAILLTLSILIPQTGCWDQKIYEKIGFMLQLGLELDNDAAVLYTASIPMISPDIKGENEVISVKINNMREGRDKIRQVSGKTVEGGKVQQIFFSEALAQKGINDFLEIFLRSPENPLLANVVVVEGSPKEMMEYSSEFENKPRPTFYVNGLLESSRQNSYVPETRVSHFSILAYSGTIDPTTPLLRYSRKDIKVVGAALFKGDKMVGKINTKNMGLLNSMMGVKKDVNYLYQGMYSNKGQNDKKTGSAILMKNKKRKIKIDIKKDKPIINIKLNFKGSLSEYSGELDLTNPDDKKKLEEDIANSIERDCMKLLKYLVEVGSDPVGFQEVLRTKHNKFWESKDWDTLYRDVSFNIDAKIKIEFYGAIANP